MSTITSVAAWPASGPWLTSGRVLFPGLLACGVVSAAASFLSQHYGAPEMLFALLLGMGMSFLATEGPCAPGIEFTAHQVSRIGIALLGLRITLDQIVGLGWQAVLLVLVAVVATITVSILAARALGYTHLFGLLSGGATAICGGSAALALAAALPSHPQKERALMFTIVGVSMLSTLAMMVYPMLANAIGLDARLAGAFLGAAIHDVPQVVGAGYGMSKETGDVATLVKLARVAMLMPVIVLTVLLTRSRGAAAQEQRPLLLPWFIVAFAVLVAVRSSGWLPHMLVESGGDFSRGCLVAAIAAIGMKTKWREVVTVGLKPIVLMVGETIFLAALVLAMVHWGA
jgi:uncharacterized integral membrane protein (TIGR00698 family)